ncbi:MAG TPA: hypothetical protein DHV26_06480, partial [Cytophagales bacterium]|nr:hypothetical protein [Cytophagales bacterium]
IRGLVKTEVRGAGGGALADLHALQSLRLRELLWMVVLHSGVHDNAPDGQGDAVGVGLHVDFFGGVKAGMPFRRCHKQK